MRLNGIAAVILASASVSAANAQQLGIGTMSQGTANYSIATAIAQTIEEATSYSAVVQPAAGTSAFLPLLHTGDLDFGIVNAMEAEAAVTGQEPFDRHLDGIKAVSVLFPLRVGIFVQQDAEIESIGDLKGSRLTYGYTSQGTVQTLVDALLANGGLSGEDVQPVLVPNVVRGADDFASGNADAAYFAVGAGKVAEVDAAVGGLRFLPISSDPVDVEAMQAVVPSSYVETLQPAPNLVGIAGPTEVMAIDYVLLAGEHVPEAVVADIARALSENKEGLVSTFVGFNAFDEDRMSVPAGAPYHAGAEEFYRDAGLWRE